MKKKKSDHNQKVWRICKNEFSKYNDHQIILNFELTVITLKNIKHFHNDFNYNYRCIFIKLVEELKGQFECLEENAKKYINFSVQQKKYMQMVRIVP